MLRAKTAEGYETSLKRIETWAGKHPVAYVTPARVRALRDAVAKPRDQGGLGHSAAFALLKTLRLLFAYAERIDMIPKGSNPATNFDLGAPAPRAALWSADDEAAFIAAANDLGLPSLTLAIELALYTAQREGDLIAFTEAQLQILPIEDLRLTKIFAGPDGKVRGWQLVQQKTSDDYVSVEMEIPFAPDLLERVQTAIRNNRARDRAAEPKRLLTHVLIDDRTGLPWKKRAFISAWTKVLDHAAKATGRDTMRDLVWHDLRRTRVVRLRRKGMDPAMIASITGHNFRSIEMMLKVYGPIDPTITAAALAQGFDLPADPKPETDDQEQSA
jgi:integrase